MKSELPVLSDGSAPQTGGRAHVCRIVLSLLFAVSAALQPAVAGSKPIIGWRHNYYGQATPPAEATNIVALSAGFQHALALRADGTVVAWGYTNFDLAQVPAVATNIVVMAAG